MDILNSYWRMEYIKSPTKSEGNNCLFSELPKLEDKDALIIYRSQTSYLVLNKYPYNPGHLLVVPYREVADISNLNEEEKSDFMNMIIKSKEILKKAINPDGYNIGMNLGTQAGAGIPNHLHCHIVPRWNGDTNFMPVVGKTRVLPEALEVTWKSLRKFV